MAPKFLVQKSVLSFFFFFFFFVFFFFFFLVFFFGRDELRDQLNAQLSAFRSLLHSHVGPNSFVSLDVSVFGSSASSSSSSSSVLGPGSSGDGSLQSLSSAVSAGGGAPIAALPAVTALLPQTSSFYGMVDPLARMDFVMRVNALERLAELRSKHFDEAHLEDVTEIKRLETLPTQKRVRDALLGEIRKQVAVASSADPQVLRRPLVEGKAGAGGSQDEARVKQRRFLAAVLSNARMFQTRRLDKVRMGKDLQVHLLKLSDTAERRKKMEEERQEQQRVQLLRMGDEEGYLKMLQTKKNARLEMLLQQTADFMNKIANLVKMEKDMSLASDLRAAEEEQKREEELERKRLLEEQERERLEREKSEEFDSADEGKKSKAAASASEGAAAAAAASVVAEAPAAAPERKDYATTNQSYMASTHTVQESVTQPKMLKFGNLREYQLKVFGSFFFFF